MGDGSELEVGRISGNEAYSDHGFLLFITDDPQCFFDLDPSILSDLEEVQIDLCFHALANEALAYIAQFQLEMIRAGKDTPVPTGRARTAMAIRHALPRGDDEIFWSYIKRQLKSFIGRM